MEQTGLDKVTACLKAYATNNRAAIEDLLAADYSFTSPLDNKLTREKYFEICWPNSQNMTGFDIIEGVEARDTVFVVYEGQTKSGEVFRNTEMFRLRDGKVVSTGWDKDRTNCYFGCASEADLSVEINPVFQEDEWKDMQARINSGKLDVDELEQDVEKTMAKDSTPITGTFTIDSSDSSEMKTELRSVGDLRQDSAYHIYMNGGVITKQPLPTDRFEYLNLKKIKP